MKVCQINSVYGYGSTGVIIKDLCCELTKANHKALVIYQDACPIPENSFRIGNIIDWKWHALFTRITGKQGYASKIATKKMLDFLELEKPDIVHLHNLHSNFINIPILFNYIKENKIATIITLHDCWFFTGKCTHFVHFGCDKWKNACGICPEKYYEVPNFFFDNSRNVLKDKCKRINSISNLTIVGCSKWISNLAIQSKIGKHPIKTIRNGIDVSIFKPCKSKFAVENSLEDKFVILGFIGKWMDYRNKEGVKYILSSLRNKDRVILVGCNEKNAKYFEAWDKVICTPYITNPLEMSDIYNAANVFINLTRFDNLPTVNMESICCGTPVITFDVGGCGEMIDHDDGIIISEGDFSSIIYAINQIRTTPFKYDVTKKQQKFDKTLCYKKYIELYQTLYSNR